MPQAIVVDDDIASAELLSIVLERAGFNVVTITSGHAALIEIPQRQPDVVIINDNMPGISGGETCRLLKMRDDTAHIPILISSAGIQIRNPIYLKEIGADGTIPKPCLPRDIVQIVERVTTRN